MGYPTSSNVGAAPATRETATSALLGQLSMVDNLFAEVETRLTSFADRLQPAPEDADKNGLSGATSGVVGALYAVEQRFRSRAERLLILLNRLEGIA